MKTKKVLEVLLDSVYNGIIAIDKHGIIIFCNKAAISLMNLNNDIEGLPVDKVFPNTQLLTVLETGKPQYATKFIHGKKTFLTNRTPITNNNEIIGAVAVFQDITDFEEISSELASVQELNRQLNAIIESIDDGILILDDKGKITKVNKSLEKATGLKSVDYLDKDLDSLYQQGLLLYKPIASAALEKKEVITNLQGINTGKELIITAKPFADENGNIKGVVSTVRDITELIKLRQELEQSQKLTNLYLAKLNQLSKQCMEQNKFITRNPKMINILELAYRIAQAETTVLILGESGVGKGLIAENIHNWSNRSKEPIVKINCSAIPKELLESELFGYEAGAFTGAKKIGKPGLLETASEGTVFLDEIGDLPLDMQVKILHVLEDKQFIRIGGVRPFTVNVRFIAATNQNLQEKVKEGGFREDLYYRLNILPLIILPLRERLEDIPVLLSFFLSKFNSKYNSSKSFSPQVISLLQNYSWPGNVRELSNVVERLVLISAEDTIKEEDLPEHISNQVEKCELNKLSIDDKLLKKAREDLEISLLKEAMEKHKSLRKAAQMLGLSHTAVIKKARKYGLVEWTN